MEDNKVVLCRLCLNVIQLDDSEVLDDVAKGILQALNPKLNLDITNDPKICRNCNKTMLVSYEFKNKCQEKALHSEIKIDNETEPSSEEKSKLCQFCHGTIDEAALIERNDPQGNLPEALTKCLGLNTEGVNKKGGAACKKCFEASQNHFIFVNACLDTEQKIQNYCESHGTNSQGKINLYKALEFMLSSKVKSELPESFQNVIKEEKGVETEIPLLKMEEIDIKTEEVDCVDKSTGVELNEDPTSSSVQSVAKVLHQKRPNTTPIQATVPKLPKLVKKKVETRSIGVQVNVRDLIEHFNVSVQVVPLDLGITEVEARPKVAKKKKASRSKVVYATNSRGASISKEKSRTKKKTYKVKK